MSDITVGKRKFRNASDAHKKWMQDPEYRKEYEALEEEFRLINMFIEARNEKRLTQAQLAKKTGMKQSAIARIESGKTHPRYKTMTRIAKALDKKIELV